MHMLADKEVAGKDGSLTASWFRACRRLLTPTWSKNDFWRRLLGEEVQRRNRHSQSRCLMLSWTGLDVTQPERQRTSGRLHKWWLPYQYGRTLSCP
ncbi:hypothetical protein ABBQ32_007172 [Trebouxia sp. C0010 RCD-2024]